MENNKQDLAGWVDARMASLHEEAPWRPDSARAWGVLRRRDGSEGIRRAGWVGAIAAVMTACLVLLALGEPRACANPIECLNEPEQAAPAQSQALLTNFRESGSPTARVTCEIYSDYQCPSCAAAFTSGLVQQLVNDYVKTGKVRLIHRDFPLPQHQYAKLAARYVNAAGRLGFYDAAVIHIFRTQPIWEKDGSIDAQMARMLPPVAMQKARHLVQTDRSLDGFLDADVALGVKDHISQTPTIVVVAKGRRQAIAPIPSYSLLKSYLDDLLK